MEHPFELPRNSFASKSCFYSDTASCTCRANKMSHDEDFQKWIHRVMSKIIENLGLNVDTARYEVSKSTRIMTTLFYVLLQSKNKTNGHYKEFSMVLKKPLQSYTQLGRTDSQFHNEILFYQMYTRSNENYAKCFYVDERPPFDSVIALENVSKRGYWPCPYVHDPPLEYTLAAMREMGRFHGKGYAIKESQTEKFFDIVTRLQKVRYLKMTENLYEIMSNATSTRAVEYLRNHGYDAVFCDKMEALLSNAFDEVMIKTVQPLEPLSTLCHGDFTLDNILFKTEDVGQYRAMLIDFGLFRCSTPVIDLSTYLCLCRSNEVIKDKFPEIMRAYHDALKEYLLEAGIWNIKKYSYEALLDDYERGGLFGFVVASCYLPILRGYCSLDTFIQKTIKIGTLEYMKEYKYIGGDEISKILADMLLHLRDLGCLKCFL